MDIQTEKLQIIEALQKRNEEWLITAMKKLLDLDDNSDEFSSEHKAILLERIGEYAQKPGDSITVTTLKNQYQAEGKL